MTITTAFDPQRIVQPQNAHSYVDTAGSGSGTMMTECEIVAAADGNRGAGRKGLLYTGGLDCRVAPPRGSAGPAATIDRLRHELDLSVPTAVRISVVRMLDAAEQLIGHRGAMDRARGEAILDGAIRFAKVVTLPAELRGRALASGLQELATAAEQAGTPVEAYCKLVAADTALILALMHRAELDEVRNTMCGELKRGGVKGAMAYLYDMGETIAATTNLELGRRRELPVRTGYLRDQVEPEELYVGGRFFYEVRDFIRQRIRNEAARIRWKREQQPMWPFSSYHYADSDHPGETSAPAARLMSGAPIQFRVFESGWTTFDRVGALYSEVGQYMANHRAHLRALSRRHRPMPSD